MALYDGSTYYTKFTFTENGKTIDRRIHRIEIQARDGRLYIIEGKDLPDFLYASTGVGFKGQHIARDPACPARPIGLRFLSPSGRFTHGPP